MLGRSAHPVPCREISGLTDTLVTSRRSQFLSRRMHSARSRVWTVPRVTWEPHSRKPAAPRNAPLGDCFVVSPVFNAVDGQVLVPCRHNFWRSNSGLLCVYLSKSHYTHTVRRASRVLSARIQRHAKRPDGLLFHGRHNQHRNRPIEMQRGQQLRERHTDRVSARPVPEPSGPNVLQPMPRGYLWRDHRTQQLDLFRSVCSCCVPVEPPADLLLLLGHCLQGFW